MTYQLRIRVKEYVGSIAYDIFIGSAYYVYRNGGVCCNVPIQRKRRATLEQGLYVQWRDVQKGVASVALSALCYYSLILVAWADRFAPIHSSTTVVD